MSVNFCQNTRKYTLQIWEELSSDRD
jgi:hypothetical protein